MTKKAFTLIELMIVVVILGILMATILPKLTWAQARARDAARVADLSNIAAALSVYYDDNGQFPDKANANDAECLTSSWDVAWSGIILYLQNSRVPMDPSKTSNSYLCASDKGRYFYQALEKDGLSSNGYVLCADVETYQKANTNAATLAAIPSTGDNPAEVSGKKHSTALSIVWGLDDNSKRKSADNNANETVYCLLRP